jgi:hypothetical protein
MTTPPTSDAVPSTLPSASASFDPPRPGDVKHSLASVRVLSDELDIRERVSFKEWLTSLAAFEGQQEN